jgi:ATP-binding cassette subfamily B protein
MKFDPFLTVEDAPPDRLGAFFRWSLGGSWAVMLVASLFSAFAGTLEVVSALLLGWVVDAAINTGPEAFFSEHLWLILGFAGFYLVLRPLAFGASARTQSVWVAPNVLPQVLSRIHRFTLGQAVTFFDNDFAGRLAQKQMQTARAVTDVVTEVINTVFFALASIVGSAVFLLSTPGRRWR